MCELQILFTDPREHVLLMLGFPRALFSTCASLGEHLLDESMPPLAQVTLTKSDEGSCMGADFTRIVYLDDEYLAMVLWRIKLEGRLKEWIAAPYCDYASLARLIHVFILPFRPIASLTKHS